MSTIAAYDPMNSMDALDIGEHIMFHHQSYYMGDPCSRVSYGFPMGTTSHQFNSPESALSPESHSQAILEVA